MALSLPRWSWADPICIQLLRNYSIILTLRSLFVSIQITQYKCKITKIQSKVNKEKVVPKKHVIYKIKT